MLAEFLPDLIVVDNAVPRCDVPALIRKGREEHPEARWVVVSGPGSEEIAVESMKAGASDYVAKKSINRLGSIVKAILEAPPRRGDLGGTGACPPSSRTFRRERTLPTGY